MLGKIFLESFPLLSKCPVGEKGTNKLEVTSLGRVRHLLQSSSHQFVKRGHLAFCGVRLP